ncbi:PaaX family transcriptional regulator [Paramicrobacterium fandaimingii]|uniref:PaaX family transcriptional regulator n=1 Tax=Paramicrobacterium fandaimingii TaxID=2708079 RepID=UPI001421C747|nr:PaaX family transcriptional regulator C-terminal domain-containing protein [Microbacterium fandaimingii]
MTIGRPANADVDFSDPHQPHYRGRRPHSSRGTRHLLITLLGDYWFARDELLPSAALVDLLAEFGSQENATRQAMRRLTQHGALTQRREGRTTSYGIPADIVASQRLRPARALTFGADFADWDQHWTVVSYSIPETERDVRRLLRNGLRTMAFGDLQDGMWITPHDRREEAVELLDDLGVEAGHVMRATWSLRDGDRAAIADAFDLTALGEAYEAFVTEYGALLAQASEPVPPAEALRLRTKLTNDWLAFRLTDPELPVAMLPSDWSRPRARAVFLDLYESLGPAAAAHVRHVIAHHDETLSHIVSYQVAPHSAEQVTPEMTRAVTADRRREIS